MLFTTLHNAKVYRPAEGETMAHEHEGNMINEFECAEDRRSECNGLSRAAEVCKWKRRAAKDSGWRDTSCGKTWYIGGIMTVDPEEIKFCPMCGGRIEGA